MERRSTMSKGATIGSLRNMPCIFGNGNKPLDRNFSTDSLQGSRGLDPVCDQGCGPGQVARYLHERGVQVMGIDPSAGMVGQARRLNPGMDFRRGNMLSLDIEDSAWGGIVAFYSIIHVPRTEIAVALADGTGFCVRGGVLLLAFHVGDERCISTNGGDSRWR